MNIIIYLIAAAVIGWLATEFMRDRSNLLTNIIVSPLWEHSWLVTLLAHS
jgi:uncharacterized membrane protein YeaQ/YmgE (transglycosylase-associated protein family)